MHLKFNAQSVKRSFKRNGGSKFFAVKSVKTRTFFQPILWGLFMNVSSKIILPCFTFGQRDTCTYCGDTSSGFDHVIPVEYVSFSFTRKGNNEKLHGPITPCCVSCNNCLKASVFDCFKERCEYVHLSLSRKTKAILWSKREIVKLDYSLRSVVENDRSRRLWLQSRADWYESLDFYRGLEDLTTDFHLKQGHELFNPFLHSFFSSILFILNENKIGAFSI